jgi:hypothetical protein
MTAFRPADRKRQARDRRRRANNAYGKSPRRAIRLRSLGATYDRARLIRTTFVSFGRRPISSSSSSRKITAAFPKASKSGLWARFRFEPEVGDPIFRSGGDSVTVWKMESLAPDGEPILWTVWVKR